MFHNSSLREIVVALAAFVMGAAAVYVFLVVQMAQLEERGNELFVHEPFQCHTEETFINALTEGTWLTQRVVYAENIVRVYFLQQPEGSLQPTHQRGVCVEYAHAPPVFLAISRGITKKDGVIDSLE